MCEYRKTNDYYFLHPELVNGTDKTVYLCSKYNESVISKEANHSNSIKNENNFGDALRLELTRIIPIKRSSKAVVRLCCIVCK